MSFTYLKEHYGDIASVVGLLVTLVGFLVTIRNVWKAREAAEEAKNAAREVVSKIKSQILVNEIASCLRLVREVDAGCRGKNWSEVLYHCDEARTSLSKITDHQVLVDSEKSAVIKAIEQLGNFLPYVQKFRDTDPARTISDEKIKQLHQMIITLGRIQGRLESQTFEV